MFWKIILAFLVFAASISLFFGVIVFFAVDTFGAFLLQEQVAPVMTTLIEAEKKHRTSDESLHTKELAQFINAEFFVGKKVPDNIRDLGYGLHVERGNFIYVVNNEGIMYALAGSSHVFQKFINDISNVIVTGSAVGIFFAFVIALLLSRHLSRPLVSLARSLNMANPLESSIPASLTERKDETGLIAVAIQKFQKEARECYQREAHFAGDVSHELRTFLAVLSSGIEILTAKLQYLPRQKLTILERIKRSTDDMASSVRSILSLARKNVLKPENINMEDALKDEILRLQAIEKYEAIKITTHKRHNPISSGHVDMASTVIGNLLRNACDYSIDQHVHIRIADRFISIINMTDDSDKNPAGCGLGLSIARRCCEKMGWKIRISARENKRMTRISWPVIPY